MNVEIQIWPYIHVNTQYIVRFVGYRIIYRSITVRIPVSLGVSVESRPAPYWGRSFMLQITAYASATLLPPVGMANSDGLNLFIGNSM
jgi:hypothetical protein